MTTLEPGDVLLYSGTGFISWAIKTKTWSPFSHTEVYIGHGWSVASRDGIGVGAYQLRTKDLALILRPNAPLDLQAGLQWFQTVKGEKYDWLGLFAFFFATWQASTNKMFCSEFVLRFLRAAGLEPFTPDTDADHVSPGMLATSPRFDHLPVT